MWRIKRREASVPERCLISNLSTVSVIWFEAKQMVPQMCQNVDKMSCCESCWRTADRFPLLQPNPGSPVVVSRCSVCQTLTDPSIKSLSLISRLNHLDLLTFEHVLDSESTLLGCFSTNAKGFVLSFSFFQGFTGQQRHVSAGEWRWDLESHNFLGSITRSAAEVEKLQLCL